MATDPISTLPRTTNAAGESAAVRETGSNRHLDGVRWFRVKEDKTLDEVRSIMLSHWAGNSVDEMLIRGDDGALYVLYGDDLSGAGKRGDRFHSEEFNGTVEEVQSDIDTGDHIRRGIGHTASAVVDALGILALEAPPVAGWLLAVGAIGHGMTEDIVRGQERDLQGYDAVRATRPAAATDPKKALEPK